MSSGCVDTSVSHCLVPSCIDYYDHVSGGQYDSTDYIAIAFYEEFKFNSTLVYHSGKAGTHINWTALYVCVCGAVSFNVSGGLGSDSCCIVDC